MKGYFTFSVFLFLLLLQADIFSDGGKKNKIQTNDHYRYIAANQIKMWIANNGDGSHDPMTDGNGLYWPIGVDTTKSAVFEDGLIFGGYARDSTGFVDPQVRVNGNTHRQGLQAGKIINGTPDDPSLAKYRIYKVLKGWQNLPPGPERDAYEADYNNWPWQDGAPWIDNNNNGTYDPGVDDPEYTGDEMLWYVANDMDPNRSTFTYGTMPMGLEFQTTVFAFKTPVFEDMVFKKYLIINKGAYNLDSFTVAYWTDIDLGDANDDYVGCDTLKNLGFSFNGDNNDGIYGAAPPAIGYDFLQGPIIPGNPSDSARFMNKWIKGYVNHKMTAFVMYIGSGAFPYRDPQQGVPAGAVELYRYMNGIIWNGDPIIDPLTNQQSRFVVPGDPVAATGWYEGGGWPNGPHPGDHRFVMSSGPFTFSRGDTQEVIIGIVIGRGTSNINSIQVMKDKDADMERLAYYFFQPQLIGLNENPVVPEKFGLEQNFPNPFNPSTKINYYLPYASNVKLEVLNIIGQTVSVLVDEQKPAGTHSFTFNAKNFSSGVYFYKLTAGEVPVVRKMMILK